MIAMKIQSPLTKPLPKPPEIVLSCRHYGDFSNPVQHSHLYRWGSDWTLKIKRIQPKKDKKVKKNAKNEKKQYILNDSGHYILTETL